MAQRIGFIGLGDMGLPMAGCLADADLRPLVWARRREVAESLVARGAEVATSVDDVFDRADHVVLMLANAEAMDEVLGRGRPDFATRVAGTIVIHMGTTPPGYSEALAADIIAAGGSYVEAPVSGSTGPAATGDLVAMVAGAPRMIETVTDTLAPMCRAVVPCGAVPNALQMKLAVNTYLGGLVTGLFEAFNYARAADLDLVTLSRVLESGPMACDLMRMKLPKLRERDFAPQGSIRQAVNNMSMITEEGARVGVAMPVSEVMLSLAREAFEAGWSDEDMIALEKAIAARGTGGSR